MKAAGTEACPTAGQAGAWRKQWRSQAGAWEREENLGCALRTKKHRLESLCHQQVKLLTENRKPKTGF